METLGERVQRLRHDRGWTARELGQRAGMGDAAISRIETGKIVEPRLATFVRLARALNVSVSELRGEPGQPSADIARISAAWSRATPAERRSIMAAIRRVERDETDETDPDDPDATSS